MGTAVLKFIPSKYQLWHQTKLNKALDPNFQMMGWLEPGSAAEACSAQQTLHEGRSTQCGTQELGRAARRLMLAYFIYFTAKGRVFCAAAAQGGAGSPN